MLRGVKAKLARVAVKLAPLAMVAQTSVIDASRALSELVAPIIMVLVLVTLPILILRVIVKEILEKI